MECGPAQGPCHHKSSRTYSASAESSFATDRSWQRTLALLERDFSPTTTRTSCHWSSSFTNSSAMEARMKSKPAWTRAIGATAMAAVAALYIIPRAGSDSNPVNIAVSRMVPVAVIDSATMSDAWDLPNLDNPRVDSWVTRFTTSPTMRRTLAIWLDRKTSYDDMISTKLAERDMPQELIYLAMIESGLNPKAKSPVAAGGLWQLISETGRGYGLPVNRRVGERNNPGKATDAALSYLSDLYDRFGSWYLAAAAYNTGENRVGRIMRETTGSERGTDADYYRIAKRLPAETRDYVPKMIAAARIAKEPDKYGFEIPETEARE